jgi:hypothetical protein
MITEFKIFEAEGNEITMVGRDVFNMFAGQSDLDPYGEEAWNDEFEVVDRVVKYLEDKLMDKKILSFHSPRGNVRYGYNTKVVYVSRDIDHPDSGCEIWLSINKESEEKIKKIKKDWDIGKMNSKDFYTKYRVIPGDMFLRFNSDSVLTYTDGDLSEGVRWYKDGKLEKEEKEKCAHKWIYSHERAGKGYRALLRCKKCGLKKENFDLTKEGIRWYKDGKLGKEEKEEWVCKHQWTYKSINVLDPNTFNPRERRIKECDICGKKELLK